MEQIDSNIAESCLAHRRLSSNFKRIMIESNQLLWLALEVPTFNINKDGKNVMFKDLEALFDKTVIFDNVEQCQEYLQQSVEVGTTIFLVCCDSIAEIFIAQNLDFHCIPSIYIAFQNQVQCQNWAAIDPKNRRVFSSLEMLILSLLKDLQELKTYEDRVSFIPIKSKSEEEEYDEENTTDKESSWWIKFIDALVHLPYPIDYCRQRFNLLKEYYVDNKVQTKLIDDFIKTYVPNDAIRWYSRDTFLYRLLNQSLRKHSIKLIFIFGYFIQDLHKQLVDEYEQFRSIRLNQPILTVYRGQIMSRKEIDELAGYRFAVNNSFLSTTLDRYFATALLNPLAEPNDELQNVLFEIKLDLRLRTRPFANISRFSNFHDEDEILFMIGTLFEVGDVVYHQTERLWLIQFKLFYDENIKNTKDFKNESSSRKTLKNCASKMTVFNLFATWDVDTIFNELIEIFPHEVKWLSALKLKSQSEEKRIDNEEELSNEIMSSYEEAIKIWQQYKDDNELNGSAEVAQLHKDIGEHYADGLHDNDMAEKYYDLALNHYFLALDNETNDYDKMHIYNSISDAFQLKTKRMILDEENKYKNSPEKKQVVMMAIKYKQLYLEYLQKFSSLNYTEIGQTYKYIAYLYKSIDQFEDAASYYEKALGICQQNSYLDQTEVKDIINELAFLHMDDRHDYTTALRYQLMKYEYINEVLETKLDGVDLWKLFLAESHVQLSDIYILLQQHDLASENLTAAMNLYSKIKDGTTVRFDKEKELAYVREKIHELSKTSSDNCDNKRFKKDTE